MMTIISYFLSHTEAESRALSKTEYYEKNEGTHRERQNLSYVREIGRCEGLSQAASESCLNLLVLFGLLSMTRCSYTQASIK